MTPKELYKNIRYKLANRVVQLKPNGHAKGAVLILYFAYPFLTDKLLTGHTNYWEVVRMAQEFLDRGYEVDITDATNSSFTPKKKYVVCIDTHNNLKRLSPLLSKECIKVLHTTTTQWVVQNTAAYKRSLYLLERRGVALEPERQLSPSQSLEVADIVLLLGNKVTEESYAYARKETFPISVSAVFTFPSPENKNFLSARKNFVWLGGAGAIHKGADLVIEAFAKESGLTLSLCGKYLYPEFEAVYKKELSKMPNIKSLGFTDLDSKAFDEIRSSCGFLIFPSCAEGQAGSVVAAMHSGLIPIISRECGVDVDGFGIVLSHNTVEAIEEAVRSASNMPEDEMRRRSIAAWEYARAHHTRDAFTIRFKEFVDLLEKRM